MPHKLHGRQVSRAAKSTRGQKGTKKQTFGKLASSRAKKLRGK